ncbi:MAG TPA: chemotaxis-specific protein-glutamate methyltransferase CheB [Chloroflexota bacterium]|nr:chemotaxis-specific protein-glutamate methyltransferase CheB [Chloroflexota bacterium]
MSDLDTTSRPLRVLVVDDSAVQRQVISRLLKQDPSIEIAGWAANGADALRSVSLLQPDLILLDDKMPVLGGLEVARRIMAERPTPIVMISAATGASAVALATRALAAGVLAVQSKQSLFASCAATDLPRLVKTMASVRLVRQRWGAPAEDGPGRPVASDLARPSRPEVVAIGASTGGPQALREIICRLPACFPLPVLVVQHTTSGYSNNLVDWLQVGSKLSVRVAQDGDPLDRGGVFVAPTGRHLVVQGRRLALLDAPPVSLHRPSATVLYRSVAEAFGPRAIGILLTGMGNDGAAGLLAMREAGALTIAQDEQSSVVFGMPAEAISLGAADHVMAPGLMPRLLLEHASGRSAAA